MEKIRLWRSKDQLGSYILKEQYDPIAEFILESVKERDFITLMDLIEQAKLLHNKPQHTFDLRLILQVKQDIEVRGLIKVDFQPDRVQVIRLSKSKRPKLMSVL